MKHQIHPQLVPMAVDMATLTPDPKNARSHDEANIKAVMDSYKAHGQRKPIVVQRKADDGTPMVIRAGNGQREAAHRLGWTHIAAIVVDENDREAIKFALRDNRSAELAEWDFKVIAQEMAAFEHEGFDFSELGWTPEQLVPLRETTWFADAKGDLEDHNRAPRTDGDGTLSEKLVIKLDQETSTELGYAADMMREKFKEPKMPLAVVIGRLARHYLATINHSRAEKPGEN